MQVRNESVIHGNVIGIPLNRQNNPYLISKLTMLYSRIEK